MKAQEKWKQRYRMLKKISRLTGYKYRQASAENRLYMKMVCREAALERIIERQQREIERAKQIMPRVMEILKQDLIDYGSCDHDVGICVCGITSVMDSIEDWLE